MASSLARLNTFGTDLTRLNGPRTLLLARTSQHLRSGLDRLGFLVFSVCSPRSKGSNGLLSGKRNIDPGEEVKEHTGCDAFGEEVEHSE